MLVAVGSVRHSPGASTLAASLAAASGAQAGLISADPEGSDWPATLGCGTEGGLVALSLEARRSRLSLDDVLAAGLTTTSECCLVPGPVAGDEAAMVVGLTAGSLADALAADSERVWVVDVGRLSVRSPALPLALAATATLLVVRSSVVELQPVPDRVRSLTAAGCAVALVTVGTSSYSSAEVAGFVGCPVLFEIPHEANAGRWTAEALNQTISRACRRSSWWDKTVQFAGVFRSAGLDREVHQ